MPVRGLRNGSSSDSAVQTRIPSIRPPDSRISESIRPCTASIASVTSATQTDGVYHIYVTYDVNDLVDFSTNPNDRGDTKMYLLKFANGQHFRQEDGADNRMEEARKAVYPYSNGDANLYVYGEEELLKQQGNAASTRTRWPWYLESTTSDPYHVKIASRTTQNGSANYFRTAKPNDYDYVVTGVTTPKWVRLYHLMARL